MQQEQGLVSRSFICGDGNPCIRCSLVKYQHGLGEVEKGASHPSLPCHMQRGDRALQPFPKAEIPWDTFLVGLWGVSTAQDSGLVAELLYLSAAHGEEHDGNGNSGQHTDGYQHRENDVQNLGTGSVPPGAFQVPQHFAVTSLGRQIGIRWGRPNFRMGIGKMGDPAWLHGAVR